MPDTSFVNEPFQRHEALVIFAGLVSVPDFDGRLYTAFGKAVGMASTFSTLMEEQKETPLPPSVAVDFCDTKFAAEGNDLVLLDDNDKSTIIMTFLSEEEAAAEAGYLNQRYGVEL